MFYRYNNGSLSFYIPSRIEVLVLPFLLLKPLNVSQNVIKRLFPNTTCGKIVENLEKQEIIFRSKLSKKIDIKKNIEIAGELSKISLGNYNDKVIRLIKPLLIGLNFTNRCKFNCLYCYAQKPYVPELSFNKWKIILEKIKSNGIALLDITGGDIFERRDVISIIRVMCELGFKFSISTKSQIPLQAAKEISRIKNIENVLFQISLDSSNPDTVSLLTGIKSSYYDAISSIKNLMLFRIKPRVKAVVTKYNLFDISSFIYAISKLGVCEIAIVNASKSYYRDNTSILPEDNVIFIDREIRKLKNKYRNLKIYWQDGRIEKYKNRKEWENRTICSAGRSSLIINPNGDITLCEQMPHQKEYIFGNILKQDLNEIWNSKKLLDFIYPSKRLFKKESLCYDCNLFDDCSIKGRCFRDSFFHYATPFDAPPYCFKRN